MDPVGAWTTLAASAALVVLAAVVLRPRLSRPLVDGLLALGGVGLGVGGLLLFDDVAAASWVAAPVLLAVITVLHVRLLFAGDGPLRT